MHRPGGKSREYECITCENLYTGAYSFQDTGSAMLLSCLFFKKIQQRFSVEVQC